MSIVFASERIQSKSHGASLRKYLSRKVSKTASTKDRQLQTVEVSTNASATDDIVSKLDTLKSLPEPERTSVDKREQTNQAATPKKRNRSLSRKVSATPVLARKAVVANEITSPGSMEDSSLYQNPLHSHSMVQINGSHQKLKRQASGTNLSDLRAQHLIQRTRSNSSATSPFEWDASGRRIRKASVAPSFSVGSGLVGRDRQGSTSSADKNKPIFDWDSKGRRLSRQNSVSSATSNTHLGRQNSVSSTTSRTRSDSVQGYSKKRISVEISAGLYREKPSFVPVAVVKPMKPKKAVPMISAPRIRNLA